MAPRRGSGTDHENGGPDGQRVTLENQIRDLAVVFGVRLPRVLILEPNRCWC
jgi:hypothetical protein